MRVYNAKFSAQNWSALAAAHIINYNSRYNGGIVSYTYSKAALVR
jgi:hypothetical protein